MFRVWGSGLGLEAMAFPRLFGCGLRTKTPHHGLLSARGAGYDQPDAAERRV